MTRREPSEPFPPPDPRTCPALVPYSYFTPCGEPVIGRSDKRYCSRTCQNREQKETWRAENRMADLQIRLRERHVSALKRLAERKRRLEGEREALREPVERARRDLEEALLRQMRNRSAA